MNEFDEKVISLVENYPHLYDKSCKDFKDDIKRANSWKIIAEKLACDDMSVKKRWDNIRDRFVRCHRVVTDKAGAGVTDIPKLNFPFYDQMKWLIPYVRKRKMTWTFSDGQSRPKITAQNAEEDDAEYDNFPQIFVDDSSSGPNFPGENHRFPVASQDSSLSCSSPTPPTKKWNVNQTAESLLSVLNLLKSQPEREESGDMCFAKSIAQDMKLIKSTHKKLQFKREVLQLLEKYLDDDN